MAKAFRVLTLTPIAVMLAAGESTITVGQPVQITNAPEGDAPFSVKVCPDGGEPDGLMQLTADLGNPSGGRMQVASLSCNRALLGGAVVKGDLLKVQGGKLVKCSKGDQAWFKAKSDGAAGDLINVFPCDKVAP